MIEPSDAEIATLSNVVRDYIYDLENIAEKVLSASGDFPKKKIAEDVEIVKKINDGDIEQYETYKYGYNQAREESILAIAKNYWRKVSKEEIEKLIHKRVEYTYIQEDKTSFMIGSPKDLADAIIARLESNGGGV